jgi:hypothetical protein
MDATYMSALAALAGSAIGGMTSVTTAWITQHAQTRAQRLITERERRENLFGRFIDEASKLYADALQTTRDDPAQLVSIYGLLNRIRLISSAPVIECADAVMRLIAQTYFEPNVSLHDLQERLGTDAEFDALREFSEACREELRQLGLAGASSLRVGLKVLRRRSTSSPISTRASSRKR